MNMLVSAAALLLASTAFFAYDLITFQKSLVNNLSIEAEMTGANAVSALEFNDTAAAENTLSALRAAPHIVYAGIYTGGGDFFAGYWRDRQHAAPPKLPASVGQSRGSVDERQISVVREIEFQGQATGSVYLISDVGELQTRAKRYLMILGGIVIVSLLAALLFSRISQRTISEPMMQLAQTAQAVTRDRNYSMRASGDAGNDEVAVLVRSFNEMLVQIQQRDRALRQAHDELETRVKERTAELEDRTAQVAEQARLLNLANDAIFVRTADGKISYWNAGAERLYGWSAEEVQGRSPHDILSTEFPVPLEEITALDRWEGELQHRKRDGSTITVASRWTMLRNSAGEVTGWLEINTDITQRKQVEDLAQRLSARLLNLQDAERRRIARELHDSVGQYLSALKIYIELIAQRRGDIETTVAACSDLLARCISETRTISHLLHPPLLDEVGLVSAIRWYLDGFSKRSGMEVNVSLPAEYERLSEDTEIALFRVLQEALTNVHRHSGSSKVDVLLSVDDARVRLEVTDYGRGVTAEQIRYLRDGKGQVGVGLAGMRERVRQLGGTLDIRSDKNGTRVRALIPLAGKLKREVEPEPQSSGSYGVTA